MPSLFGRVPRPSGGQISAYPPVFTADSECFMCATASQISLFSVKTAKLVRTISPEHLDTSHTNNITALVLNPTNSMQVFSASLDGSIRLWDINDGSLLNMWNVDTPISHLQLHPINPNIVYFMTTKSGSSDKVEGIESDDPNELNEEIDDDSPDEKNLQKLKKIINRTHKISIYIDKKKDGNKNKQAMVKTNSILYTYNLQDSMARRILKTHHSSGFRISSNGEMVVVIARYKLHVGRAVGLEVVPQWTTHITDKKLVCLALHPTQIIVATGDERGRIKLWRGLEYAPDSQEPAVTMLHWHAKCINHIVYSPNGDYLLSGGDEATLVMWHLSDGQKRFLPRLGSEILSITISPDKTLFAIAQLDNSIRIISAVNFVVQQAIVGLRLGSNNLKPRESKISASELRQAAITVEPRNNNIVLNGTQGIIQFYNAATDRHIGDLQVAPPSSLMSSRVSKQLSSPIIHHTAFDSTGSWLATTDSRMHGDDKEYLTVTLRIWWFDVSKQQYILNTKVNGPHGAKMIMAVAFRAGVTWDEAMIVTTGADRQFKVWEVCRAIERVQLNQKLRKGSKKQLPAVETAVWKWRCRSSGYFKELTPTTVAWSDDGSVLAVSFAQMITLWDPSTMSLQHVLTLPTRKKIYKLAFGSARCPYLFSASGSGIYIWNLLSLSVAWSYVVDWATIAFCKRCDQFALSVKDTSNTHGSDMSKLMVFKAESPVPILIQSIPEIIISMAYLPYSSSSINLVYLTSANRLKLLSPATPQSQAAINLNMEPTQKQQPFFSSMYQDQAKKQTLSMRVPIESHLSGDVSSKIGRVTTAHPSLQLLDGPAHTLLPVYAIYDAFMTGWLKPVSLGTTVATNVTTDTTKLPSKQTIDSLSITSLNNQRRLGVVNNKANTVKDEIAFVRDIFTSLEV